MARELPKQVEPFAAVYFIGPESIIGLMFDYQSFVDMMMHLSSGNGKPYHLLSQIIGPLMLFKQTKVAVYQGIHKKTISKYPLFIPPVTGGLLCNQGSGPWGFDTPSR